MGASRNRGSRNRAIRPTPMETPCEIFRGSKLPAGYGTLCRPGERRSRYAHREAYEKAHGPIPKGMFVLHRCDNPPCINPTHLFLGTAKDNSDDSHAKGRAIRPPVMYGEENPRAKLTESAVRKIRAAAAQARRPGKLRFRRGSRLVDTLAERYGVTPMMIYFVIRGKNWLKP